MYKKSSGTRDTENEVRIDLIKEVLTKIKKAIENVPKDDVLKIEEKKEIIDAVQRILKLDNKFQSRKGLKILDQMLIILPVSLAQLKAGNNSEKLKDEIRKILYSLYRSKKLTKTIYNNLINTI